MSTFEFENNVHSERLRGTLHVPGATPGDVPTAQADGSLAMAAGGGSQPVTCVVEAGSSIDASGGVVYFTWDTIVDNLQDGNTLADLPAGIGIDPASIPSDTLTTTELGTWAFTLIGLGIPADATFDGQIVFGNYNAAPTLELPVVAAGKRQIPLPAQVVTLPAGTGFSVGIAPSTGATANPFTIQGPALSIVRLA